MLAVGLDTSQMDGHVLGEAGLLTHLFFCNVSIRATHGTGDTVKQKRVPTLGTRRLKGPREPNRSNDVSRLGRKLWVRLAGGKPCCQQGVPQFPDLSTVTELLLQKCLGVTPAHGSVRFSEAWSWHTMEYN